VEQFYGVQVSQVNTIVVPSKAKSKYTKAGFISGRKSAKKKAIVTVAEGETIDIYGSGI
jgi:large subunit ribosomal protein L23